MGCKDVVQGEMFDLTAAGEPIPITSRSTGEALSDDP